MKMMTHSILFGAMLLAAAVASGGAVTNATVRGTLATNAGASIRDDDLARWIDTYIPTNTPKLLVLTQCYGGDMAKEFADKANTVVISATSEGEEAIYGGYDAGATGAMQPGAGRTAQDIHNAGVDNRDAVETPTVTGGMNPTNFPMSSVSTSGVVRSRHVIMYAGQPDGRPGRDVDQDARLQGIYANESNTTYRAVAASTAGGWDYDGTARGLREAIQEAGTLITNSPNPAAEQFILYASDHGDRHVTAALSTILPTHLPVIFNGFPTFSSDVMAPNVLLLNTNTVPGFSVFIPFEPGGLVFDPGSEPFFPPPDWWLTITIPDQPTFPPLLLTDPVELPLELDNGTVGDFPGEGVQLFFPVDKQLFVDSFFDVFVDIEVTQTTGQMWPIARLSQDSGEVPKGVAPSDGRALRIERSPIDTGMLQLSLPGVGNVVYTIQSRSSLLSGAWEPLDTLIGEDIFPGAGGRLIYPIPPSAEQTRFFRALFPQPVIEQIEPALAATDEEGAFFYISGLGFYPGDTVLIDGEPALHVEFDANNLLRVFLPAGLLSGLYDVTVVSGHNGAVLAALTDAIELFDPLTDPLRALASPPEWPPAGPAPTLGSASRKILDRGEAGDNVGLSLVAAVQNELDDDCNGPPDSARSARTGRNPQTGATIVRGWNPEAHGQATAQRYIGTEECDDGNASNRLDSDDEGDSALDLRLHSGEVEQQIVDLAVPGRGVDFAWVRTYRSRTGAATAQGNRWSHSYDVRSVQSGGAIDIYDATGRKDTFRLQTNGSYTCPEFFREGTLSGGTLRLTFADTGYWEFNPFDAISPAGGKLARIVDRHGNTVALSYDGSGRLTTIVDDLDRTNTVAYNPEGQIASVSDFSGRTVTYAYYSAGETDGLPGDLKSVTSPPVTGTSTGNDFPSGKTTTYTYSTDPAAEASGLLTSIIDARGQTTVQCTYEIAPSSFSAWRCIALQRGTDAPTRITYLPQSPAPDNRFAALRCIVNDPEGNVSERDFDVRNRCVALREFTGRAQSGQQVTATANRPVGKLRAEDPDFFETIWSWNNDSLCTLWQRPLTNRVEWVYQADLDPATPPRQRGNLRILRDALDTDSDDDGLADVITWNYEHDPRFGSDPTRTGGVGARRCEWSGGWYPDCDDDGSFASHVTNPLGFETRCVYDANGNLITLTRHGDAIGGGVPPILAREDFEYNAYGQLSACDHAEDGAGNRRYDLYLYGEVPGVAGFGYRTQTVVDAGVTGRNLTTSYEYDDRGNMTRCEDPRGTPTDVEVNALNQTVSKQTQGATFGEKVRARFFYDAANNLVQVDEENRDGDGTLDPTNAWFTTEYEYDALHRLTRQMKEDAVFGTLTNEFVYDGNDRLVLSRSPLAVQGSDPLHLTHYAYDERCLLFRETHAPDSPLQSTSQCDYDANGNLRVLRCGLEDATGERVTQYLYDGFDRCVSVTDPMGNETHCEYDANRNRTRMTVYGETTDAPGGADNRLLSESRYDYDELDRCIQYHDAFFDIYTQTPLGDGWRDTAITYAPNGLITAITNDLGRGTTYTFDTTMFLTGIVDAKSNRVEYTYDANGNVLTATQTGRSDLGGPDEVFVRSYAYDALNRCVADWDNSSNTNLYAYDSRSNLVRHTDPLGFSLEYVIDQGRLTSKRMGVGGSAQSDTHYTYDVASRLVASTDSNTNTTQYAYDSLDRLVRTTLADGTSVTNVYDIHGNLVWTRDANGTEIACVYDALARCLQKSITPGPGVASDTTVETYQYDGLDRLVRAVNNHTEIIRDYDSLGRCVREGTASTTLGLNPREYTRVFDAHGLLLVQTNYSGRIAGYSYDELDRDSGLSKADAGKALNAVCAFAYAGPDRLARVTFTNGIQSDYTYSGLDGVANQPGDFGWGQIQRISHGLSGAAAIDDRLFAYDRSQNKTVRSLTAPFVSGGPTNRQEFVYDSLDRLVHSVTSIDGTTARDTSYVLDPMGNRLSVIRDGVSQLYALDPTLPAPADFQVHQYTDTPFDTRQYDENGNLHQTASGDPASPETRTFSYDYADRLVAVQGSSGPVATYAYDALGRRIVKIVYDGLPPTPVLTNRYLYADGRLIEEEDGRGAVLRTFVMPHVFDKSGRATITASGELLFHHCDDQGSLLALTDEEGHVVERFDYDEYGAPVFLDLDGNPRPGATAPLTGVPQLFHGMIWNAEIGLYGGGDDPTPYMNKGELVDAIAKDAGFSQSRYYDPKTGRTLSRTYAFPHLLEQSGRVFAGNNPGSSGGTRAQDYNSSRSNATSGRLDPDGGGSGSDWILPRGSLKKGDSVQLIGFGSFSVSQRAIREGGRTVGAGSVFSYIDCFPTRYVFPGLSAQGTGNIRAKLIVPVAINKGLYSIKSNSDIRLNSISKNFYNRSRR